MTDTQKRIKAYKDALPGIKERLAAVALLLVISLAMVTSATFAWLTISKSPALTGVNMSVAANGNLEVALVAPDGSQPGVSKVGDSSAAEGQTISSANITWGNLVNLSDPAYGLENLVLRPAQLNTAALLTSPLYGAMYNEDGRITQLNSNFAYTTWIPSDGEKPGYFGVSDDLGVRAISSTYIKAVGAEVVYVNMVTAARDKNTAAANAYASLKNNTAQMQSLATMMGLYMTARMNPSHETLKNPTFEMADLINLRAMYASFIEVFDMEADAIAANLNLQLFLLHGEGNYTPYTVERVYAATEASLKAEGLQVTKITQFNKDRNTLVSDMAKMDALIADGTKNTWTESGLNTIVNNLVDVGKCTIGKDNTPISSIGASNALGYLSGTQEARITNGILYNFEERTGGYIEVKNLQIKATINRNIIGTQSATVKANIQTTAPRDYNLFTNDWNYAQSLNTGDYKGGIPVAEDTYGLAVDLWVRTNAEGSFLTLEGNVLTVTEEVRATGKTADGTEVELFTITVSAADEAGNTISYDVDLYKYGGSWYYADNHTTLNAEEIANADPDKNALPKMTTITTVVGYEGENRVWGSEKNLSVNATTQGSGSCYVYYADNPEDQARSLKLLSSFNVAFVDAEGKLLAEARMDTEHYYAENGRVIVPLVLDPGKSLYLGTDVNNEEVYAISMLEQNVPTRVTAIVYLDGTKLSNEEVLAAADIQGQLNIQFGSSMDLKPINNEELELSERKVTASVSVSEFDYDTVTGPMVTQVKVNVTGEQPKQVTAFFIRAINSTQGSREQEVILTQDADGAWVTDYTFTTPGTYVLRTVRLDGVDYVLADAPTVVVKGFAIQSLSCSGAENNHISVMTADRSVSADLTLKFVADDVAKMPKVVQGRFLKDDGSAVNVNFSYDATIGMWKGTATFLSSGEYEMQYLLLDGEYTGLDETLWQSASVTLGMRVSIYTTSPQNFKYLGDQMAENEKLLGMQVMITDDTGAEMRGLTGAKLQYRTSGSMKSMDTDLTWNGEYYVGELVTLGPGIWSFSHVTVGENTLTNATYSPTFTIVSPEPPEYYAHQTAAYQFASNKDARMEVRLSNASAATVEACLYNKELNKEFWVRGTIGGDLTTTDGKPANIFYFSVPKLLNGVENDTSGYQDGNWQITKVRIIDGAFSAAGEPYTEENPWICALEDQSIHSKVVNQVFISFAENKSQNFGKDAGGTVTGAFMQSYGISGIKVRIQDFEGKKINGIKNVSLEFKHNGDSKQYGGYRISTDVDQQFNFKINLTDDGSGTLFAQGTQVNISYAGSYSTTFSYMVGDNTVTLSGVNLPSGAPTFTVSSVAPTVRITAVSPTGNINVDTTGAGSGHTSTTVPAFTATEATVYFSCTENSTICSTYHNYSRPSVTITLEGIGSASKAELNFGSGVHIYNGTTQTTGYIWTANGTCVRNIGYYASRSSATDQKTPAGDLSCTTLVLTDASGNTYSVTVRITIHNPY